MVRRPQRRIVCAALGECVHTTGIQSFLTIARDEGCDTVFLGPAVPVETLLDEARECEADIIAVSYRLTPSVAGSLFGELKDRAEQLGLADKCFLCGGTEPVVAEAERTGLFDRCFTSSASADDVRAYLRGGASGRTQEQFASTLTDRIVARHPRPILRSHFGRPDLDETFEGVRRLAESFLMDVISIGPDQYAQENFFHQDEVTAPPPGAGGVPIRTEDDLERIAQAARTGNFPLLRCYSGTRDIVRMADVLRRTIDNAWCAVPLTWYSQLDGRSGRSVRQTVAEAQEVMRLHGQWGVPLECNEAHQWSMRDAHDALAVAMAFLGAYTAKAMGVRHYVSQYMLNTPKGTSPAMDLAKMLAKIELIESLHDESFVSYREVRAGLVSMPADPLRAMGQLAASTVTCMHLSPSILHIVGYSEAVELIGPEQIIDSAKIVEQVIDDCLLGLPNPACDLSVEQRKRFLVSDAELILQAIRDLGADDCADPLLSAECIGKAVDVGILDAPGLAGCAAGRGLARTEVCHGACVPTDGSPGGHVTERERLDGLAG